MDSASSSADPGASEQLPAEAAVTEIAVDAAQPKADAEAQPKADAEAAEDESAASQAVVDNFKLSAEAAEFVPGKASASPFQFQFNAGAMEFKMGPASADGPERRASEDMTLAQQMPTGYMPVYPVIAVQVGAGGSRPMAYMSSAGMVASPVGHMAVGFTPNMALVDGSGAEDRKGGKGRLQHREGVNGRGGQAQGTGRHGHQEQWTEKRGSHGRNEHQAARGFQQHQKQGRWQEDGDANGLKNGDAEDVTEEQPVKQEEEPADDKEPKKKSWADIARAPVKKSEVPSSRVVKAVAANPQGPTSVVPKEVTGWGPKGDPVGDPGSVEEAVAATAPQQLEGEVEQEEEQAVAEEAEAPQEVQEAEPETLPEPSKELAPEEDSEAAEDSAQEPEKSEAANEGSNEEGKKKEPLSWAARLSKKTTPAAAVPSAAKCAATAVRPAVRTKQQGPVPKAGVSDAPAARGAWVKAPAMATEPEMEAASGKPTAKESSNTGDKEDSWETPEALESEEAGIAGVGAKHDSAVEEASSKLQEVEGDKLSNAAVGDQQQLPEEALDDSQDDEEPQDENEDDEGIEVHTADDDDEDEDAATGDSDDKDEDDERVSEENEVSEVSGPDSLEVNGDEICRPSTEPGKPDAGGVIRYTVTFLRMMSKAPYSEGSCPASIPQSIRSSAEETKEKQRYGMKFLEQFKEKSGCQDLPANHRIPKELRGDAGDAKESKRRQQNNEEDDWRASAMKTQRSRDKDLKGSKTGSKRRPDENLPKLQSSELSWAAKQQALKEDSDNNVVRNMKSVLNKLTVEKFDTLYQKLLESGIETEEHAAILMKEVFEKATLQHHFIEMYTGLCIKLNGWFNERGIKDQKGGLVSFRTILLNQCQDSFDEYLKPPEGLQDLEGEEQFEAKVRYKTKMIGNMKFVGQLLINKALSSKIILQCTEELLNIKSEETLETLCAFLLTVGPEFDKKDWRNADHLDHIFQKAKELSKDSSIPSRVRCLLQDVLDLRASGWCGHRPSKEPEGPKRMAEVKEKWAKENSLPVPGRTPSGGGRGGLSVATGQDDEWETVPTNRRGGGGGGASAKPSTPARGGQTVSTPSRDGPSDRRGPRPAKESEWRPVKTPTGSSSELLKPSTPSSRQGPGKSIGLTAQTKSLAPSSIVSSLSSSPAAIAAREDKQAEQFLGEVKGAIREVASSFDLEGGFARVKDSSIPAKHQKAALGKILVQIVESSVSARPCLWNFAIKLFSEGIFQKESLLEGLEAWFTSESFEDLKMDVPNLAKILSEEWLLPLHEKGSGLLSSAQLKQLQEKLCASSTDS